MQKTIDKRFCIQRKTGKLAEAIKRREETQVIFIDTGAAIDFERQYVKECLLKDHSANIERWYNLLQAAVHPGRLYVPEYVFNEMRVHSNGHRVNGHPEISQPHWQILGAYNREYINFLKSIGGSGMTMEEASELVYAAAELALADDDKKRELDRISDNDIGLLSTALWTLHTTMPYNHGQGKFKKVNSSTILSPDRHITKTIEQLAREHPGLRAVNPREILSDGK